MSFNAIPTGTPAIDKFLLAPKLDWTIAPTVYIESLILITLEALSVPPLKPKHIIPVPPPTLPSSIYPSDVLSIASKTCSSLTWKP